MNKMTFEYGYRQILPAVAWVRSSRDEKTDGALLLLLITLYNNKSFRQAIGTGDGPMTIERLEGGIRAAVECDETCRSKVLLEVMRVIGSRIENSQQTQRVLEETYRWLSSVEDAWYDQYLTVLFEGILRSLAEDHFFMQPSELTRLMTRLCGYDGHGSVYNPYAGAASCAVEMKPSEGFVGEEVNPVTWAIGVLRMIVHGLDSDMLQFRDSLEDWSGVSDAGGSGQKFDCIISTPPFSMKLRSKLERHDMSRSFLRSEDEFLYRGASSLKDNGILTAVLPTGITFRETDSEKELRRELVERGLVSKVILLPANILYGTVLPSVIIQLRNTKPVGTITMMDASSFFGKTRRKNWLNTDEILQSLDSEDAKYVRTVSVQEVAANNYSLFPPEYFVVREDIPEGYGSIRVSDILRPSESSPVDGYDMGCFVLNISDLSKDDLARTLDASSLKLGEIKPGNKRMATPFVAVSRSGPLRPTLVEASEEVPVYVGANISVFSFNEGSVFMPLFLYEWSKRSDELPDYGTYIQRKSITQALEKTLHLPADIDEQRQLFIRLERQEKLARARELDLEDIIASQKNDFLNILRSRKHDLDNCLGAAKNDFSALSKCLKRVKLSESDLVDKALSENVETTIGEQLEKIRLLLDKMSAQIKHLADENVFGDAEKVDLNARLNAIRSNGNYIVRYKPDIPDMSVDEDSYQDTGAFVKINPSDLDRVIDNIIRNAEKHGFKDSMAKYVLEIFLTEDYDDKMYVIDFQNNGQPMPKGMDTQRYGIDGERGKDSDGQGKGGSIVKAIVEHFGGKYEVFNNPDDLFPVGIRIKLPIYDD